jgi:formylglycine-generating enzyme required for sulfatase activity
MFCELLVRPFIGAILILLSAMLLAGGASARAPESRFRDCTDCPLMRVIPAGSFVMGSPPTELGRQPAEGPQHKVTFKHAFALGLDDVTRAEFARFADETGYRIEKPRCDWRDPRVKGQPINQTPNDPVVCVSWGDATAYASWLSKRTGKTYRLPSEAEWEYAARAGTPGPRPWGDAPSRDHANYGSETCCAPFAGGRDRWLYTSPVGAFPANAFGLHDMLGNVWQRTEDCAHDDYSGAPGDGAAWTTGDCSHRMVRGGGWFHPLDLLRAATRAADAADFRVNDIGFRLARSL